MVEVQLPLFGGFQGFQPLADAKKHVQDNMERGTECPCCGQLVKLYRRSINSAMARVLIWMARRDPNGIAGWANVHDMPVIQGRRGGGDFAKLEHWGLIESYPKDAADETRRTSGWWKITPRGRAFAAGASTAWRYVYLFNGCKVGDSSDTGETTTIESALGKHFSFTALWEGETYGET